MKLTVTMHATLTACSKQPLRRVHDDKPGKPAWPSHPATLAALIRHGLIERSEQINRHGYRVDVWQVTEHGRKALEPVILKLVERPMFLDRRGYTSRPSRSIDMEQDMWGRRALEAVDAPDSWVRAGRERHAEDARRENARALARRMLDAA